jgi:hypothetical protein
VTQHKIGLLMAPLFANIAADHHVTWMLDGLLHTGITITSSLNLNLVISQTLCSLKVSTEVGND